MAKYIRSQNVIASVAIAAAAPVSEPAHKNGRGKAKQRAANKKRKLPPTLEALGVPSAQVSVLQQCEQALQNLDRKDTLQVFEIGAVLAQAKAACGSQEVWAAWSKKRCGISRRSADNYVAVHERLGDCRELFVEHAVQRVSMYLLCSASPDKLRTVVERVRKGEVLQVAEVRALVKEGVEPKAAMQACDIPGAEGIKALARERVRKAVDPLTAVLIAMLRDVRQELATTRSGKPVNKARLAGKVEHAARRARCELLGLAGAFEPNSANAIWRQEQLPFPADSGWGTLAAVLVVLGSRETWPKGGAESSWFEAEVEPALTWAVGPKGVAAVRQAEEAEAKAAEAERGKAAAQTQKVECAASPKRPKRKKPQPAAARKPETATVNSSDLPVVSLDDKLFVDYDLTDYLTGGDDKVEDLIARAKADAAATGKEPVLVKFSAPLGVGLSGPEGASSGGETATAVGDLAGPDGNLGVSPKTANLPATPKPAGAPVVPRAGAPMVEPEVFDPLDNGKGGIDPFALAKWASELIAGVDLTGTQNQPGPAKKDRSRGRPLKDTLRDAPLSKL